MLESLSSRRVDIKIYSLALYGFINHCLWHTGPQFVFLSSVSVRTYLLWCSQNNLTFREQNPITDLVFAPKGHKSAPEQ